ncbi:hypothetical protein P8452_44365 [Trifolium repens]|nr:hypothetical protein P8452_44365 [Trifolium repens]
MINDVNHLSIDKSFRIKQDDKFFSRLKSKEASSANTSSRIMYYGETSIAIPFVWEAQPVGRFKENYSCIIIIDIISVIILVNFVIIIVINVPVFNERQQSWKLLILMFINKC